MITEDAKQWRTQLLDLNQISWLFVVLPSLIVEMRAKSSDSLFCYQIILHKSIVVIIGH